MMLSNSRTTEYHTVEAKVEFQTVRPWMVNEGQFVWNGQRREEEKEHCRQNR